MFKKIFIVIFALVLFVVLFHPFIFDKMYDFLVVQDKPEKSDVILVLAGDSNGERVDQAVKLYKEGYAPKILMSGGPIIWKLTSAQNMKSQAIALGVPPKNIFMEEKSLSTLGNIKYSIPILKRLNAKTIILVTSPFHARRARAVARKYCLKENIRVLSYPVQASALNPDSWWTRREDTEPIAFEYIKLIHYLLNGELF
ncbi:hypothetical protein A2526_04995 [candidate division WOR-1 bacterium RIFOXYD2_FULL_36_8]|uniref:DUF218 domain-containing protein n=1 Tax=candidate division WOR-1 bacterium RIFOXYB2_FULL_36_35 TaxID=1802578 RepID=A0A1F4S9C9_UNCSA|nr:MAG: hypothetical protein A2230_01800 [candidate division WOR-1 bacterium RIFOXYA2_FULL_36_21]OGC16097.1 MAG: hypothetical protein A2282_05480 [candidate division WOR-1 bacterium RIFOXYA12_FULL_36_13]OGC16343.1 MAG: hypothetical protein A2290_04525 [candidate division WOR-1 bacterium RIFOXYB2_FULL_36_35]OGC41585.1 MAG: hypothetical protein A2526_04995 [candidate division WOR-1 bacterium RIFOXYD2_FULL_36_8]